jgi:NAD(P)-dependent dehydrogenase (short-subunit alcohol dehydrogenase family)
VAKWTAADLDSQAGRTVIVTGANSGLGKATTKAFAAAGARVVMAVRDLTRGQQALDELSPLVDGPLELRRLDLADLASVRAFADGWDETVDVLVNNAGIMAVAEGTTADGFETQLGTNHLGHFVLTNLLLPHVADRVVTVSSGAHRMGKIDLDDLNWQRRPYSPWRAYGQSKLANLLFTLELQRRLRDQGSALRAMAAHPGYAATNLQSGTSSKWADRAMAVANKVIAQSDEMGALPTLFAASQDIPGGSYVGPDGPREGRGHPTLVGRTSDASDVVLARQLWATSAELTGVDFPADPGAAT